LYTAAQVRALDTCAIQQHGIAGFTLMQRAAAAAFAVLQAEWPTARQITVLCGAGNNAGDGYVLASLAQAAGLQTRVIALVEPTQLSGDAATAAQAWLAIGAVEPFSSSVELEGDVLVDALLGTGLSRAVAGDFAMAIANINQSNAAVLALDLPSGLHADTGAVLSDAVRAQHTISFIGHKIGAFTGQAADYCGELHFADLDVPEAVFDAVSNVELPIAQQIPNDFLKHALPPRARASHKGDHGHVLMVGGDYGYAGAVLLASQAALRSGAGRLSLATRREHVPAALALQPEIMAHSVETMSGLSALMKAANVIAIGPGLAQNGWGMGLFAAVLERREPLVVDADGLNLLACENTARDNWVLTPHPGEAARLLNTTTAEIQADRPAAALALAVRYNAVVVLKGAGTIVAAPADQQPLQLCPVSNPGMASGGMGDVLTGIIAAFMAQGMPVWQAAVAGVQCHAMAAQHAAQHGERGLLASDVIAALQSCINP